MDRRERRHNETREEILRAARALVVEKGAAELSLREVAARTQFTPPALYVSVQSVPCRIRQAEGRGRRGCRR